MSALRGRLAFRRVLLDGGEHDVSVLVEVEPLLARASSGSRETVSALLQAIAEKLLGNADLTTGEKAYLAESLLEVADDMNRFGGPFGYQGRRGRPTKLSGWRRFQIGRAVDRLNNPKRYGSQKKPLPLLEVYGLASDQLGVHESTVRRAHESYLHMLKEPGD